MILLMVAPAVGQNREKSKRHKAAPVVEAWNDTSQFKRVEEVCNYIRDYYVEKPDYLKITEKATSSMLSELDPHSIYIPAKNVSRANEGLQGNFEGVGVSFQIVNDTISVTDVIVGGPSEKVGLQIGDKLLMVDDTVATFKGVNNNFVYRHLRGKKGTVVKLTVKRHGVDGDMQFSIVRDKVPIYSVDSHFMLDDEVGYIRLSRFARTSVREVHNAIVDLRHKGMKRLVFDLRGNGGGYLDMAVGVANLFLSHGKLIVYTEGEKSKRQDFISYRGGTYTKDPLVVLIDEYSASASEIVSGAVQDWDRGILVGRRSFGKGLVQRMFTLYDGAQIRLTTARYYTPSGRCIQRPYDAGKAAYDMDLQRRYYHKELTNADSVVFPDSLRYHTVGGRVVYGGGGIMPDVFVPMDTVRLSDFFISLRSAGAFNTFALKWADAHRDDKRFASYNDFVANYDSASVMAEFDAYASKLNVKKNDVKGEWVANWIGEQLKKRVADTVNAIHADNYEAYMTDILADTILLSKLSEKAASEDSRRAMINQHSNIYMGDMVKALIARNLYGTDFYYQIMRRQDEGLKIALKKVKEL